MLIINQIKKNGTIDHITGIYMSFVSLEGYLEILKWTGFNNNWNNWNCIIYCYASEGGHLKILKWLKSNGYIWSIMCPWAALGGHLKILKWFRTNGCKWNDMIVSYAAEHGRLEILAWCRNRSIHGINVCPWNLGVCEYSRNHPHIQSYIHSLPIEESPCGCPRIVAR
jgi:hypothetical protein